MPRHASAAVAYRIAAVLVCLAAGGCAPPVVKVSHSLPAALPVPAGMMGLRVGEITVAGPDTSAEAPAGGEAVAITPELARLMKDRLGKELYMKGWIRPRIGETRPAGGKDECLIGGTIRAVIQEVRGKRTVMLLDPASKATKPLEVPTLIRTARVRVEFALSRAADGQGLGIAEIVRTYDSAFDPAVRGELGLDRPDDPNHVPPVEMIVKDLLAQCAHAFKCLISPTYVYAEVQLRPVEGAAADEGFAIVRKGYHHLAMILFLESYGYDSLNPALNFNLAAVAEAAGQLDIAIDHYDQAVKLSGDKDAEAYEGARRCRRVLEARNLPATSAAGEGQGDWAASVRKLHDWAEAAQTSAKPAQTTAKPAPIPSKPDPEPAQPPAKPAETPAKPVPEPAQPPPNPRSHPRTRAATPETGAQALAQQDKALDRAAPRHVGDALRRRGCAAPGGGVLLQIRLR